MDSFPRPKVSVRMITYNHEPYIAQAIEGVLMQVTTFPFELVIGEDCSADGTAAIVNDYARRFPDRIRVVSSEANVGRLRNYLRTLAACRGEYVAMVDGDDFWTAPDKLQAQADLLDSDPGCVLCFHRYDTLYPDGTTEASSSTPPDGELGIEYLIGSPERPLPLTVMFRNGLVGEFPTLFHRLSFTSLPYFVMLAEHGRLRFIDRTMAVYRVHAGGVWSRGGSRALRFRFGIGTNKLAFYGAMDRFLEGRHHRFICRCASRERWRLVRLLYKRVRGSAARAARALLGRGHRR
jgi:glycosyltransferase involved in cell wall biosynthesis